MESEAARTDSPAPGLNAYTARERALQKVANETMRYRPDCRGVKARFFYSWITAVAGASARSVAPMPWLSIDSSRAGAMLSWASSTLQGQPGQVFVILACQPCAGLDRQLHAGDGGGALPARSAATAADTSGWFRGCRAEVRWISASGTPYFVVSADRIRGGRGARRGASWEGLRRPVAGLAADMVCRSYLSDRGPSVMDFLCSIHTYVNFVKETNSHL